MEFFAGCKHAPPLIARVYRKKTTKRTILASKRTIFMLSINFAVYINIELKVYTVLHSVKIAVIVGRFYVTIYFIFFSE